MSEVLRTCETCRSLLDGQDLFCGNCGAGVPDSAPAVQASQWTTHAFECQGCGASMSYDASVRRLKCPFCGSEKLEAKPDHRSLAPRSIVPFAISRTDALRLLREWMQRGAWRPSDLVSQARVTDLRAVYVPVWVFEARVHTFWTADSADVPPSARGDWHPRFGERRGAHAGLLIGASAVLTPGELAGVGEYRLDQGVPPEQVDLKNVTYEPFTVARKFAHPQATSDLHRLEEAACRGEVDGTTRNLQVNLRIEGLAGEPMLAPVWIAAYRYQDRVYRFLLNGQTGRATGQAPSTAGWWLAVGLAIVVGAGAGMAILAGFLRWLTSR